MSPRREATPPRPIRPGDVVAGHSEDLDAWGAVQVTHLDPHAGKAGVLDLDWAGREPSDLAGLGPLRPLTLTHHANTGRLSHTYVGWVLPRSCRVIGTAPVLVERPPSSYTSLWNLGLQLSLQRRWDSGDHSAGRPGVHRCIAADLPARADPLTSGTSNLTVFDIDDLDCQRIADDFPSLTSLSLAGTLGTLRNARALESLARLKHLAIGDLFGMRADDCPRPEALRELESLYVDSVPAEFATSLRRRWLPQVGHGMDVDITRPRRAGWVEANRDNPLRGWEGRAHISTSKYKQALAQYRTTRQAVFDTLATGDRDHPDRLVMIGREYGEFFNHLDGSRKPFIETEEREELGAALMATVAFAEASLDRLFAQARGHLLAGLETVRRW